MSAEPNGLHHKGYYIEIMKDRRTPGRFFADYWPVGGGTLRRTGLSHPTLKAAEEAGRKAVDDLIERTRRNTEFFQTEAWDRFVAQVGMN